MTDAKRYRIHEFAELAGVTVRALHHYDRLGLLRPQRNRNGFRVYTTADLERLQNIVALKFIGLPLKQIRTVLNAADNRDLAAVLHVQILALEQKKRRLELALQAVRSAESALRVGGKPCLKHILEVMNMENEYDWILRHFSRETQPRVADRLAAFTGDTWSQLRQQWSELAMSVKAAVQTDPAAPENQRLLARWEQLLLQTTGGDQDLIHGLKSMYADRVNWPGNSLDAFSTLLDQQTLDFLRRTAAARR